MAKGYVGVNTFLYTPIEYIEATGTQWIDTGVKPNQNTGFEIDFIIHNPINSSGFASVLGSSDTDRLSLNTYPATAGGELYVKNAAYNPYITQNVRKQITYKNSVFSDNNGNTYTVSKTFSISQPIFLFTRNINGTPSTEYSSMVLFSTKFYDGDTLIRDFIPVLDGFNVACLYDLVEGKFYYNKGTGTFTAGNATGSPVVLGDKARKIKKGYVGVSAPYTPVSYLESNSSQYIDTGVYPNANIHCIVDFQMTTTNTGGVIGGWDSSKGMLFGVNNGNFQFAFGTSAWAGSTQTADFNRHTLYMNDENGDGRLDNTILASHTNVSSLTNTDKTLYLFGSNGGVVNSTCRIFSCQIYDGDTLIRNFIPVIDENGKSCLLDNVGKKFYYAQTNNSFITNENPEDYEILDYIQTDGNQTINSGITANVSTRIIMKCDLLQTCAGQTFFATNSGLHMKFILGAQGKFAYSFQNNSDSWNDISSPSPNRGMYIFDWRGSEKKIYMNNTTISMTGNASTSSADNISLVGGALVKLYYCEIYQNGKSLSRQLLPVKNKITDEIGLFDFVEKTFYPNVGTGTFSQGSSIGEEKQATTSIVMPRKIVKAYASVNKVARLCFGSSGNYDLLFDYGEVPENAKFKWYNFISNSTDSKAHQPTQARSSLTDKLYVYCYQSSTSYNSSAGFITEETYDMEKYSAIFTKASAGSSFNGGTTSDIDLFSTESPDLGRKTEIKLFAKNGSGGIYANYPLKTTGITLTGLYKVGLVATSGGWGNPVDVNGFVIALLKKDDISELFNILQIQGSTINDLLTNSSALLNNENAVKYMVKMCTGDFMGFAVTNSTFMAALNSSPYKDEILANPHWNKFYTYVTT